MLGVVIGVIVLKGLIEMVEARLVFFPYKGENENPATLGIRHETVSLTTSDGERLVAWQLEPHTPLADIVYFHGNGGNLSVWLPMLATLHRLGYRVFAFDYRGYGLSSGAPSEKGLYRDAEAAVRHVATHRSSSRPLVFWGRSLGATVAAFATRIVQPNGLILEGGFPDKAAVIRTHVLFRTLNLFSAYRFPTVELLRDFRKPVLVLHGTRDAIIPFALGRELFDRLEAPKQLAAIEGADHNDFFDEGHTAYWAPISRFIKGLTVP